MKNILLYYYKLDVKTIRYHNNSYFIYANDDVYILQICNRSREEILEIYELSRLLRDNDIYCHEIILNNNSDIITIVDNKNYILLKSKICSNEIVSLNEIISFSIRTKNIWNYNNLNRFNWKELWNKKLENLEYQISQFGDKYQNIFHCFSYYAGIVENDIQLISNINTENLELFSVSHKRMTFTTTLIEFYNPLNYVIDYSIRDVAEYIKSKMIYNLESIYEYVYCISSMLYDKNEKKLLFARILYPSYQLDEYEKYFFKNSNDNKTKMQLMLGNNENYEKSIKKMYEITKSYIDDIPHIEWLI